MPFKDLKVKIRQTKEGNSLILSVPKKYKFLSINGKAFCKFEVTENVVEKKDQWLYNSKTKKWKKL